jgi:hypothetical protein
MKTARCFFTMVFFGALTLLPAFAGEPSKQPSAQDSHENHVAGDHPADPAHGRQTPEKTEATDGRTSNAADSSHAPARNSQAGRLAGLVSPQPKSVPANKVPQSAPKTTAPAAKARLTTGGWIAGKTGNPPAKLPVGSGTTAPKPGPARGRPDAPAAIGGSTASGVKQPAMALDGATLKPRS